MQQPNRTVILVHMILSPLCFAHTIHSSVPGGIMGCVLAFAFFFVLKSTSCPFPLPHCITGTYIYQIAWVAHCRVKLTNERHCRKTGRWKEGRSKSISLSLFFSFCLCSKSSISFMFPDSASEPLALWS